MARKLRSVCAMPTLPEIPALSLRTLTDVFATTLDGVLIVGRDGLIRYINPSYCALVEYQDHELLGQPLSVLWLEHASLTAAHAALDDIVAEGGRVRFETLHRCKDGRRVWVEASVAELPEHGELVVCVRDISERKSVRKSERKSERKSIITQDGFCTLDRHGVIQSVNDAYCAMMGYSREHIIGNHIVRYEVSTRNKSSDELDLRAIAEGSGQFRFETEHRHNHGRAVPVEVALSWLPAYGEFMAFIQDITERKRREDAHRQAAFFDPLTQLPNRRMLIDRFPQAASRAARRGTHSALLFIDLDGFKLLNDTEGHAAGDALLCEVARRLTRVVRNEDAVVRLGGDEFVVLVEDLPAILPDAVPHALAIAERVCASLADEYRVGAYVHKGGCSVGLALFRDASERMDEVLRRADVAMYAAKQAGGCAVRICDAAISS